MAGRDVGTCCNHSLGIFFCPFLRVVSLLALSKQSLKLPRLVFICGRLLLAIFAPILPRCPITLAALHTTLDLEP